jgi:hypothetical protein
MRIDIFHHFTPDSVVLSRLDDLEDKLDLILEKEDTIMSIVTDALDQAEAAAAANSAADDAAEALLTKIAALIADLKNNQTDPATVARITALSTALNDRAGRLSAAVVANTPAAPTP